MVGLVALRPLFDHVIDVVTLGVHKPHRRTYMITAARMRLDVGEFLFVDDMQVIMQVIVDGAEAVGIPGFFFDHTIMTATCARLLSYLDFGRA